MGSETEILRRLERIEAMLTRLFPMQQELSIETEAAMVRMQGRDLAEYLRSKSQAASRKDQAGKRKPKTTKAR